LTSYDHLDPRLWPLMEEPDERRIDYILLPKFIPYPRAEYILQEVGDLCRIGSSPRPKCILVSGSPGSGKSMILREALRLYGCEDGVGESGRKRWPFFSVELPHMSDIRPLYGRVLTKLGVPHSLDDKAALLHEQTWMGLQGACTILLGLDEIHNLLATKRTEDCMTALRDITNHGVGLLCAGIESARNVISADPQMADRFRCHRLRPWTCSNDTRDFLATLQARLPLRKPSELHQPEMLEMIVGLSQGHLGKMVTGVREAARDAIRSGKECLDTDAIKLAMQRQIREGYDVFA